MFAEAKRHLAMGYRSFFINILYISGDEEKNFALWCWHSRLLSLCSFDLGS